MGIADVHDAYGWCGVVGRHWFGHSGVHVCERRHRRLDWQSDRGDPPQTLTFEIAADSRSLCIRRQEGDAGLFQCGHKLT